MVKAVVVSKFGNPASAELTAELKVVDVDMPHAGPGEVVIKMLAMPVNPADIFSINGVYPGFQPASLPAMPGLEGVGKVVEVGPGVTGITVGQRVVPFFLYSDRHVASGHGSWQEYVSFPATEVFIVPDYISTEEAAQIVVNPTTAYTMLDEINPPKGSYVLQTAAGSVLARQFIQFAKARGVRSINIVRRAELVEELKAIGADEVFLESEDWVSKVKAVTGGAGAYGAIDPVAGRMVAMLTSAVRPNGQVIIYGAMNGLEFSGSVLDVLFRGVVVKGFWVTAWTNEHGVEPMRKVVESIWPLLKQKTVVPFIGKKYKLAEVADAVKESIKAARGGKVMLVTE
mmetsp:Transcript_3622/g.5495  ORF Transcript_3622/g.5495 Transcript_3622/m.5495 type:complete len:343 (+) Transcript_3622:96-1124(+)|eukprot:CAMPEP_0184675796 /NCGR_PEP_ID=MMETSP0308-20130426/87996_1 /TAXON_ID=38269 /ORGANISM="Gloeochaete witrockiana, Strain SAG 46.84" /LENGTH=342 /DNA_ID=CAMNT_0027123557 /DNA_START=56 /DNA_END=1084 /DNA_ORIENTATION=-